jgi:hypothetical protein
MTDLALYSSPAYRFRLSFLTINGIAELVYHLVKKNCQRRNILFIRGSRVNGCSKERIGIR